MTLDQIEMLFALWQVLKRAKAEKLIAPRSGLCAGCGTAYWMGENIACVPEGRAYHEQCWIKRQGQG
jgi:hypothetical protein